MCPLLRKWVTMVLLVLWSSDVFGDRVVLGEFNDRACLSEGRGGGVPCVGVGDGGSLSR